MDQIVAQELEKLQKAIAAERSEYATAIDTLKGEISAEVRDKVSKIEADIDTALTKVNTEIQRNKLAAISADPTADREATQAFLASVARPNEAAPLIEAVTDAQVEAHAAYSKAFWAKVRRSGDWDGDVYAEMSEGSQADGGYMAPGEMLSSVERKLFETSDVRRHASIIRTSRPYIEFPVFANKGSTGGWVTEKGARTETDTPRIGTQKIDVHEQYAEPHATQTILDDAIFDVAAYLETETAAEMARTENTAFVVGDGVGKPKGFMSYAADSVTTPDATRDWGVLQHRVTGAAAGFPFTTAQGDDARVLIDLIADLHPEFRRNARWFMRRATEAQVRKLRDGDGRYISQFGRLEDGTYGFLVHGFPVSTLEDMPAFGAGTFPIGFGDMRRAYTIVDRIGIRVLRDPYTSKPFVKFYMTKRVGGDLRNSQALKLLKVSN